MSTRATPNPLPDETARGPSLPEPATLVIPADGRILYFTRDRTAFRFLSHFFPARIVLDGIAWPTVEHYYQAQRSFDAAYRAAIMAAGTPGKAKRLAVGPWAPRRISHSSWFRKHGAVPRKDWAEARLDIMRRADAAKFAQNRRLAALLVATGDSELIEDSPSDSYWGTGRDGTGLNMAGRVLMDVRETLRGKAGAGHGGTE